MANHILNEEKYFILFNDGCIINIAYTFNSRGEITKHTLIFLCLLNPLVYLRFDYNISDIETSDSHFSSHMHISLQNNSFRIPVNIPLSPKIFLYIILKYYYRDDSPFTKSLLETKWKNSFKKIDLEIPFVKL